MKAISQTGTAILLLAMLLSSILFSSSAFAAEEGALIRDSIIKGGAGMKNIQVYTLKTSGGWALATLTYDENRDTKGSSALLQKSGRNWDLLQFSGKTPTTDLLKQNNIPQSHWGSLIDATSISKTKPILDFLHSKYPRLSFESIEISEDYALARWYGGEDSGMALLKKQGGSWKVLLSTGGVIDGNTMRRNSVPAKHIGPLMGIQ